MKTSRAIALASVLTATGWAATAAFSQFGSPLALIPEPAQDGKVTIEFTNATPQAVFERLKAAGIDFVVETSDIPKDKRLTLSIRNKPALDAVKAVAGPLGMHVSEHNGIYSLSPGAFIAPGLDLAPHFFEFGDGQLDFKIDPEMFKKGEGKWNLAPKHDGEGTWSFKLGDGKELTEEQRKEVEAALEKARAAMKDAFGKEGLAKKELDKALAEAEKAMAGSKEEIAKALKEAEKAGKLKIFRGTDFKKLVDSLTPEQWEKSKSQGYLSPSDLTDEQLSLLGEIGVGSFTIHVERDGKSVTFKGK